MRRYEIHITADHRDGGDEVTIEVRDIAEDQHWTEAGRVTVHAGPHDDLADVVARELPSLGLI